MDRQQILELIYSSIEDSKTAVLAVCNIEGDPTMRWMTPACLKDRPGSLFMASDAKFAKVNFIRNHPSAELMVQSRSLDRVINIRGGITVLDNVSIRLEVLECVGSRLHAFWKASGNESDMVVLEFAMVDATVYLPMTGERHTVHFLEQEHGTA